MLNKITPAHQQQLACVYMRQSTIEQVRLHRESTRRQRSLAECAQHLGWRPEQVLVIDEDLGKSAAVSTTERLGYQKLLTLVGTGKVGIILAVEISRLAREDIAWQILFRHCLHGGVLLGDEQHVYDPRDPHERMMLGLLATFAGFELSLLRERMQQAWKQKAQRGELYCGCAPGYQREDTRLVKSPDQRVRHVIETLLSQFAQQSSVGALCRWCCEHSLHVPVCLDGQGRRIEWRPPTSASLVRLLRNPVYAGAYVLGRSQTQEILQPDGQVHKQTVRLPLDKWPVLIHDHHEAYISWEQYERNWRKMQANDPTGRTGDKHAVGRGEALLAGLLRCRRCGHGLYVRYNRKGTVRYLCLGGGKQREGRTQTCFSFPGQALDEMVGVQIVDVVRPAGVDAALQAAEQLSSTYRHQRQVLADQFSQCRYEADRARRQYDEVEPENRLVCTELERRWNQRLGALATAEQRLSEFDQQTPAALTPAEHEDLLDLGRHLEAVWFSPHSPIEIKKQIVRLLVEQIVIDVTPAAELQILIHWVGGHHSEHKLPRRGRTPKGQSVELLEAVQLLRLIAKDEQIARILNRTGIRTPGGANWTTQRVAAFRGRNQIACFDPREKQRRGLLRQDEAAACLEISPMSVHRLLSSGILPGRQARPGLPWVIEAQSLELEAVRTAAQAIKQQSASTPVDDPNQPTLW